MKLVRPINVESPGLCCECQAWWNSFFVWPPWISNSASILRPFVTYFLVVRCAPHETFFRCVNQVNHGKSVSSFPTFAFMLLMIFTSFWELQNSPSALWNVGVYIVMLSKYLITWVCSRCRCSNIDQSVDLSRSFLSLSGTYLLKFVCVHRIRYHFGIEAHSHSKQSNTYSLN